MSVEFSVAQENLKRLAAEYSVVDDSANEAQTRFSFIDRLLQDCLGWLNNEIKVETYEDGERSDYECGTPRALIVEAKRSSSPFSFPPKSVKSPTRMRLDSLMSYSDDVDAAVKQVQGYCRTRGVELAVVANGPQLIVFLATRFDGRSPLTGEAYVFDGYDSLVTNISQVFDLLSADGVKAKRYLSLLQSGGSPALPSKLSSLCMDYLVRPRFRRRLAAGF